MIPKIKAGLLPLYLKLYDDFMPGYREPYEGFLSGIVKSLEACGIDVAQADICRVASEFEKAIERFENEDVDCIVALHLAYSPSLESLDALTSTKLPLVLLDTSVDFDYGFSASPERSTLNQGIHGCQDLANMLWRRKRTFQIVAGHVEESAAIARVADIARAANAARRFVRSRALRIGEPFPGMGDVSVPNETLESAFGATMEQIALDALVPAIDSVSEKDIRDEIEADRKLYECEAGEDVHRASVKTGLGVRRYLEDNGYDAFSAFFLSFASSPPSIETLPFLEASKAMARGVGYAGEGDTLTAAFIGALCSAFGRTTFTEAFCPDWKGNSLFISHMGEINPNVAAEKPLLCEKPFPMPNIIPPAILACAPAPGPATLVNVAPGPDDSFQMIAAPVEILGDSANEDMRKTVRGWIRPGIDVGPFLEQYSRLGGSHHCALILGSAIEAMNALASFLGIRCHTIGAQAGPP